MRTNIIGDICMKTYKVTILGDNPHGEFHDEASGKSSLINRMCSGLFKTEPATVGAQFYTIQLTDNIKLEIWDTSGRERFSTTRPMYIRHAHFVLYCVDLSTEPDIQKIKQGIEDAKRLCPEATVILVATKSDKYRDTAEERLYRLSCEVESDARIVTSAKDGNGISFGEETLASLILARIPADEALEERAAPMVRGHGHAPDEPVAEESQVIPPLLREPAAALSGKLDSESITEEQRDAISAAFDTLLDTDITPQAVQAFVGECHTILEGKHPNIMSAVYALAGAVVVAGIIAAAGIGFGVAAIPLAITSCIWGAATSALVANSMFNKASRINGMLSEFSDALNDPANDGPDESYMAVPSSAPQ